MKRIFGFKQLQINGVILYTYCIMVKNSCYNHKLLTDLGIPFIETKKNKLIISNTLLDYKLFQAEQAKLGRALKSIALNNVEVKYQWINETSVQPL